MENPAEYTGNMQTLITNDEGNVAIVKGAQYDRWYFVGKIDDVRIYNRGLSATEVMQLANTAGKIGDVVNLSIQKVPGTLITWSN